MENTNIEYDYSQKPKFETIKGANKFKPSEFGLSGSAKKIVKLFNNGEYRILTLPETYVLTKILKDYALFQQIHGNTRFDKLKAKADKYDSIIKLLK